MDDFAEYLLRDFSIFGLAIQYWVFCFAVLFILWGILHFATRDRED
jgi:hypothetical protein